MSPRAVAEAAARRSLDLIAVCDHNSAENVSASVKAGQRAGVRVIPGMEVTTREEAHLVALFPTVAEALVFQGAVYARLEGRNDEDAFGTQVIANEQYTQMFRAFNFGRGAAIAIVLLVLVIPVMWYNLRQFGEQSEAF